MDHPGWYPPSQVCLPPELPSYLKNVCDLKPIVGLPSDAEVIGIHTVIQAASRVSSVPGMHDPGLTMKLTDHLFSVQMAIYRNKYTSLLFPSDATYKPPILPAHVLVNLDPVSCAPTDDQVIKVHEAIRSYQKYSEIPTMFEPKVHADLSQHLFDIQMATYMYREAQRQPNETMQVLGSSRAAEPANTLSEATTTHNTTNNAGTGASITESLLVQDPGIRDILERSNQLAERANQLSERSNQLIERSNQIAEQSSHPVEQPTPAADQSNSHFIGERFGELLGQLNQYLERSNQLTEGFKPPVEHLKDTLRATNKVLAGIQHAIIRGRKDNTYSTIRSLVNEKGDFPISASSLMCDPSAGVPKMYFQVGNRSIDQYRSDEFVAYFLRFYGIEGDFFEDPEKTKLRIEQRETARANLGRYLTAALAT